MAKIARRRVRFVVTPDLLGTNGWLALRDDLSAQGTGTLDQRREIARRFACIQAWFSDLDDFDTRSPAKIIAMRAVGTSHLSPAYVRWIVRTLFLFCRYGKKAGEAKSWKLYYDAFLKRDTEHDWLKDEAFEFIDCFLTPDAVARMLYPSVAEFYASLGAKVYLVTRNLERIAYRYSKVLPYSAYYHEVMDKAAVVEAFIKAHPEIRFYGSGGDSTEDEDVAELLDFHYRTGRIEKPVCLFRASSPFSLNRAFNVYVGKNRAGLAGILAEGAS